MLGLIINDRIFGTEYPIEESNINIGDRVSFSKETVSLISEYNGSDEYINQLKSVVESKKPYFSVLFVGTEESKISKNIVIIETAANQDLEVRGDMLVKVN